MVILRRIDCTASTVRFCVVGGLTHLIKPDIVEIFDTHGI